MADWLAWQDPQTGRYDPASLQPHLKHLLEDRPQQQALRTFVQSQVEITRALFSFRDSFQGPTAVLYDPQHFLSSQTVNRYDMFHLLRNYHLSPPMNHEQFQLLVGVTDLAGDFYVRLLEQRNPRLVIELSD